MSSISDGIFQKLGLLKTFKCFIFCCYILFLINNYHYKFEPEDFYAIFKYYDFISAYILLIISVFSLLHGLILIDQTSPKPIEFLENRLSSITFFDGPLISLLFLNFSKISTIFLIPVALTEVLLNSLILASTYAFSPDEKSGDQRRRKIQAKQDVIHLYSSHATLFLIMFCISLSILLTIDKLGIYVSPKVSFSLTVLSFYFLCVRSSGAILYSFFVMKSLEKLPAYFAALLFLSFVWPCLLLCLIIRSVHLCLFCVYLQFLKLFNHQKVSKANLKFSNIVASLRISGENSAIRQFVVNRLHPMGCLIYNNDSYSDPIIE